MLHNAHFPSPFPPQPIVNNYLPIAHSPHAHNHLPIAHFHVPTNTCPLPVAQCPFMPVSFCPSRSQYPMISCLSVYCYEPITNCPCLWHVAFCQLWVLSHLYLRISWGCSPGCVRFLCSDLNALFKQHIFGLSPHGRITCATCFLQLLSDDIPVPAVM